MQNEIAGDRIKIGGVQALIYFSIQLFVTYHDFSAEKILLHGVGTKFINWLFGVAFVHLSFWQ